MEQKKYDQQQADRHKQDYNSAIARWESQPGRIPPSLPSAIIGRQPERDNSFWGMVGPGFLYLCKHNVVLANIEAANAVHAFDNSQGLRPLLGMGQRHNPWGFPMNIHEMHSMVHDIRNRHAHWRNDLYLLVEFYRISLSVRLEYQDLTMQMAVMRFQGEWVDVGEQFESLKPLEFIPLPATCLTSNPCSTNHGAGLGAIVHPPVLVWTPRSKGLATDSTHADFYSEVDQQWHVLLDTYGVPPTIDAHQGWWYPDTHDLECIQVLHHVQDYESTDRHNHTTGTTSIHPIYNWFHVGEHYVYEWLSERPPPNEGNGLTEVSSSSATPRLVITLDEDMEMDN
ncbi:hypothetical protein IW262DRAFT_1451368 [Armillaria fumosa]|nr:hypothetical protein IW262DRAFT_1451368 [Armillaria fumosa]